MIAQSLWSEGWWLIDLEGLIMYIGNGGVAHLDIVLVQSQYDQCWSCRKKKAKAFLTCCSEANAFKKLSSMHVKHALIQSLTEVL